MTSKAAGRTAARMRKDGLKMCFALLQHYRADHPFSADIFDSHPPGAVELMRFWKLGLENVARGPPKITQRHISRKTIL
jgi:hypothetical protein